MGCLPSFARELPHKRRGPCLLDPRTRDGTQSRNWRAADAYCGARLRARASNHGVTLGRLRAYRDRLWRLPREEGLWDLYRRTSASAGAVRIGWPDRRAICAQYLDE